MVTGIKPPGPSTIYSTVKQGVQTLRAFFNKFNNDWVMSFASALAFNLITAILPIVLATWDIRLLKSSMSKYPLNEEAGR